MEFEKIFQDFDIRSSRNLNRKLSEIISFDDYWERADINLSSDTLETDGDSTVVAMVINVYRVEAAKHSWRDPRVIDVTVRSIANTVTGAMELMLEWWKSNSEEHLTVRPTDLTPWKE